MNLKKFFTDLWMSLSIMFSKHLPGGWEKSTEDLINGLNVAQTFLTNATVLTLAGLFPNGIGTTAITVVAHIVNDAIPTLEIALGCEKATEGITDPILKADAILQYCIANIGKLPADMQGKHIEDIARKILESILGLSTTAAKALINTKLGQMKTATA